MICQNCNSELIAEIKKCKTLKDHYDIYRPVWFCSECELSTPVMHEMRNDWVDNYKFKSSGLLFGIADFAAEKCLACESSEVYAEVELILQSSDIWPFYTIGSPAWCCSSCGFSKEVLREDRYLWADTFKGWY